MPRILVTRHVRQEFSAPLEAAAPGATWIHMDADGNADGADPEIAFLSNDVFFGPLKPFVALVRGAPSLRWLQSGAAGTDSPVVRGLLERGVRVTVAHVTAEPIAEYVLRAVLDLYQEPQRWADARARRVWERHDFREVAGTTWVVIGLGAIGRAIALRARAFGARVVGVRRTPDGTEPVDAIVTPERLADAVPDADVIVLAAPATPETRHLVDEGFLARMRPGSVLVNVARGALVDETALLAALDRGVPSAAVLDVFATEPLPSDSPWWDHPRVVMTPHGAGAGTGRLARAVGVFTDNLRRYLASEPLRHEVTLADLELEARWVSEVQAGGD